MPRHDHFLPMLAAALAIFLICGFVVTERYAWSDDYIRLASPSG